MIKNEQTKTLEIKIVYYGCGMSGKTTSLRHLFKSFNKEEALTSIETSSGRTLFFDFGVIPLIGGDWTVKLLIYSATGQDFYSSTRPSTLNGADGIVFIIDSQKIYANDNLRSWNELKYYYGDKLFEIPLIICPNKQDLPNTMNKQEILESLELFNYPNTRIINTIAKEGKGVIDGFKSLLSLLFPSVIIKN